MIRILAILFVVSIFIPVEFHYSAGGLRLEFYRLVLALVLIYSLFNLKQLIETADIIDVMLLAFVALAIASLIYNHGYQQGIESSGIFIIEVLGSFYLARNFITTPRRFYYINISFIYILAIFMGLSLYEGLSHQRIIHDFATLITGNHSLDPSLNTHYYIRSGILRATSFFSHPILYGTLLAMFFPFAVLLAINAFSWIRVLATIGIFGSMVLTMSSAPMLSLIFQGITSVLARYWADSKHFWYALLFFIGSIGLIVNSLSNRGFFAILISYLTLNPATGYYRLFQWEYASDDIFDNPLLGIGISDWSRPEWLNYSIDSFWLLITMQHGIPAGILLLFCSLYAVFHVMNKLAKQHIYYRWMAKAWVLSFFSLILIGFTVDYFGKLQPMFFFMLGGIAWIRYPHLNQHMTNLSILQHIKNYWRENKY